MERESYWMSTWIGMQRPLNKLTPPQPTKPTYSHRTITNWWIGQLAIRPKDQQIDRLGSRTTSLCIYVRYKLRILLQSVYNWAIKKVQKYTLLIYFFPSMLTPQKTTLFHTDTNRLTDRLTDLLTDNRLTNRPTDWQTGKQNYLSVYFMYGTNNESCCSLSITGH